MLLQHDGRHKIRFRQSKSSSCEIPSCIGEVYSIHCKARACENLELTYLDIAAQELECPATARHSCIVLSYERSPGVSDGDKYTTLFGSPSSRGLSKKALTSLSQALVLIM